MRNNLPDIAKDDVKLIAEFIANFKVDDEADGMCCPEEEDYFHFAANSLLEAYNLEGEY